MPIYEYKCPDCGREFEELVVGSQPKVVCPKCGGEKCDKLMSAASFRSKVADGSTVSGSSGGGCAGCSASSCAGCGG
ncbi:hypothetical protein C4J81_05315 [Deltaproteobacteria bacterium Smac51]|nr:hypothetical protein C4J81_05315 [Deltaproteobacteria bacterium Smac51]